jgi:hypothetical protein
MQAYELEKLNVMKFCVILFSAAVASAVMCRPAAAARPSSVSVSGPETTSDVSALRLSDPDKELRHLSKNLKLKRDQRAGVSSILQERNREIRLLLDIESLSQEYRDTLATKVIQDSDAQIETLLRSNQKRKFDIELARVHETR